MITRDDARKKCIKTQMNAFIVMVHPDDRKRLEGIWLEKAFEAAFDSLNGIVTVNLPEATEEMNKVGWDTQCDERRRYGHTRYSIAASIFGAMAKDGDLTNPPEKKS